MPPVPSPTRRAALAFIAGLPFAAGARDLPPYTLAMEAPADVDPAGFLVSEKYDGVRALWDGRQLRFRSGLPVAAPARFISALPDRPLDGELWLGRGRFEAVSGLARRASPDDGLWRDVRYMVFDLPGERGDFATRAMQLQALAERSAAWPLTGVAQEALPDRAALQRRLAQVVAAGGEGLMLHRADAPVLDGRHAALLKLKPLHDAEAVVVGHLPGQGRHAGRLGALRVRTAAGVEFRLGTGLSDALRDRPPAPGRWLTYTHRGHTAAGVPRFASFLRLSDG